jgi:energy-coupling factor transport system ATP-binding protein
MDRIETLHRQGLTIVLVTHSMDEVARLADRVVVMHAGRVVSEGTPQAVFAREDDLHAIGLDLPQAARLMRELRHRGIAVGDALTMTQARQAILAVLRGHRGGA